MSSFVSLNSWNQPGAILQAAEAEEMAEGGPEEWGKLREWLERKQKTARDSVHPRSAAVEYVTYEGAFRFGWFPEISVLAENGQSALWNERRAGAETRDGILSTGWRANQSREEFEARVARAQEYITAGDIYQVNLAQKFTTWFGGNAYRLFEHLLARSPAPGGAFLDFGKVRVLSASPELFLRIRARPQRLLISLEISVESLARAAATDDVALTVNYFDVTERVKALIASKRPCKLLETLAENIATELLAAFPIKTIIVEIKKFILPDARWVSVQITRKRE